MHLPGGNTDSVLDWNAEAWKDWQQQSKTRSAPCWVHVGKKVLEQAAPLLQKSQVECAIFGDGPSYRLQYLAEEFQGHLDEVANTWSRSCLGGTLLWQRIARDIDRMFPGEAKPGETRETQLLIITDGYDTDSKAQYRGLMGCRQLAQDLARKKVDAEIHIISLGISSVEVLDEYEALSSWSGGSCYAIDDIENESGLEETLQDFQVYVLEDSEQRKRRRTEKRALYFRKFGSQNAYPMPEGMVKPPSRPASPEKPSRPPSALEKPPSRAQSPELPRAPSPQVDATQATPDAAPVEGTGAAVAETPQASRPQSAVKENPRPASTDLRPVDTGEVKSLRQIAQDELRQLNGPSSAPPLPQANLDQQKLSKEADRLRNEEGDTKPAQLDTGSS